MYSTAKLVFEWNMNPFDRVGSDSLGPLASSVLGLRESGDLVYEWLSGLSTRSIVIVVCSYFMQLFPKPITVIDPLNCLPQGSPL